MKKELIKALAEMSETDYHLLGLHLQVSNLCRDIMRRHEIASEYMRDELGLTQKRFKAFLNGAYPYDMLMLAKLQAFSMKMEMGAGRLRVEAQVRFPEYKYSKPIEPAPNDKT